LKGCVWDLRRLLGHRTQSLSHAEGEIVFLPSQGEGEIVRKCCLPRGGATEVVGWGSMVSDGWSCEIRPSPLVPRDPPKGRVRFISSLACQGAGAKELVGWGSMVCGGWS
jgi:hypothetical protein